MRQGVLRWAATMEYQRYVDRCIGCLNSDGKDQGVRYASDLMVLMKDAE